MRPHLSLLCSVASSLLIVGALLLIGSERLEGFMSYPFGIESWMVADSLRALAFQLTLLAGWRRFLQPGTRYNPITIGLFLYGIAAAVTLGASLGPGSPLMMYMVLFHAAVIVLTIGLLQSPDRCCRP
jgi:hypothetical protein